MMTRLHQAILIGTFIPFCWMAFMGVHELGHIVTALCTGGNVTHVVLHPLSISRTDVSPNPFPLLVVWAGPVLGSVLPLMIWEAIRRFSLPFDYLARFFAGFCLVANGVYIAVGSFEKIGDAGDMLKLGSSNWQLWLFGLISIPLGFLIWHGLGPKFGLGESSGKVDEKAAYLSLGLGVILFVSTFFISPRF